MNIQYSVHELCAQLGLGDGDQALDIFINKNSPVAPAVKIYEADFWSPSQRAFLKHALTDDAEWTYAVDELDTLLRTIQ